GPFPFDDDEEFSRKDDYPKWKDTEPSKQEISLGVTIELDKVRDVGFYQFVTTQLKLENPAQPLALEIGVLYRGERPEPVVTVRVGASEFTGLDAQQVLKKLQTSRSILFHNSTETETRYV